MSLPLVIEASELAQYLDNPNLLIIDLSDRDTYLQAHIPGALHLDSARLMRGTGPVPNKLPSAEQLSALFSELGLTADKHVVVYDHQKGPWAGRMIWTLNAVGHERCSFLNGQLKAWTDQGFEVETQENTATPGEFKARINPALIADIPYLKAQGQDQQTVIWDARSAAEYSGEKVINAQKGGHIPGAKLYEWTDLLNSDEDSRLRPADELLSELAALGITTDKEVITHCQTHRRSGLTYLAAKYLGFDRVRCYDGSWFEWGNQPDTPIEK
ncbi:MAG: sulfurtransferase [Pontibacterium sp.]